MPSGSVTFMAGATLLGSATPAGGTATLTTTALPAGAQAVTAVYSGDANYTGSGGTAAPFIATTAGNGTAGYLGDNGPATAAELSAPTGVALDGKGDVFIADQSNNVVRELNLITGKITTVAGNGTAGFSGDNGPATAAELKNPSAVAVDANGDLFIADTGNNRIREVNLASGIITTFAGPGRVLHLGDGGLASAADLSQPSGVAVDASGDVFIADTSENRVREVNRSSLIITTCREAHRRLRRRRQPGHRRQPEWSAGRGPRRQWRHLHCRHWQPTGPGSERFDGQHRHGGRQRHCRLFGRRRPGHAAELKSPWSVAVDSGGNVLLPTAATTASAK